VRAFRVAKDFTCEGVRFHKGEPVSPDSPLAQVIHREYPEYFVCGEPGPCAPVGLRARGAESARPVDVPASQSIWNALTERLLPD
jgi:hypothetical protein